MMNEFLSLRKMLVDLRTKVDEDFAARMENASMRSLDRLEVQAIEKLDKIDAVIRMAEAYLPDLVDAELIREIILAAPQIDPGYDEGKYNPDYDEYKDDPTVYAEYDHIKAQWANRPEANY